jgi:hypothetical protein
VDVLAMSSSVYSGGGGAVGVGWSGLSQFDILSFGLRASGNLFPTLSLAVLYGKSVELILLIL